MIPGSTVGPGLSGTILQGLAVTSHNPSALSSVSIDTVNIRNHPPASSAADLDCWTCADVGGATPTGGQSLSGGAWTLQGAGGDIWATSDQFHFVWQPLMGDGGLGARVTSQTNTDPAAKAGVMLRQSIDPAAIEYSAFITPGSGVFVQYRSVAGGATTGIAGPAASTPVFVQVRRAGNSFTAYTSNDGTTFTLVPNSAVTLNAAAGMLAGMAVTSHNTFALSTATLDTVNIGTNPPPSSAANCPLDLRRCSGELRRLAASI